MISKNKNATRKPWRKILYENQNYPDNYTDKNIFLRDLRKNIDFKEVSFWEAVFGANLLLQEFCTVVLFFIIYFYIVNKWTEPSVILNITSCLTLLGFLLYLLKFKGSIKQKLGHDLRTVLTFVVFGQLFSPVLHTLTDTISTDTIYTLTFLMMLIHLIFFDYGVSAAIVSKSLSLSAAIFPSICLASRLSSASEAFILMTVATKAFVLFPILRIEFHNSILISIILLVINTYLLFWISNLVTFLFIVAVILINVICPLLFVKYQKLKDNIYGPWDEAIVDDADSVIGF
ncbi:phosphatidylinositol N-acetylglucosaminyltransferase subunit C [Cylas formicarius]|uniref:phosphatidylinositol N-acetylglucosaminyltransferase subunit C n=1 Tax=Cylas formicarius TaxID=197179 RepID=UPI002958A866|nr:phosphatidylinositol N-acetylglucosaminyltransferase subunit C [Cylas formicarius]